LLREFAPTTGIRATSTSFEATHEEDVPEDPFMPKGKPSAARERAL
jgi:hypothetical protein